MTELYTVTPRTAKKAIEEIIEAGLVPHLVGPPGCGKSTIIRGIGKDYGLQIIDHRMSTSEPTDMTGLPRFNGDHAEFVPFVDIFPTEDVAIPEGKQGFLLFLDEFMSMKREVQAGSFKLILDRMVGQKHLHPQTAIVTASNRSTDRSIVNPMATAMQSRLIHLEMEVSFAEWLEDVAIPQNYDSRIIAFLNQYPSKLMDFRPDHEEKTFCAPRTWEFMNRLVKTGGVGEHRAPIFAGTITSGTAAEFIQHCEIYTKVITVERICHDAKNCPMPDTPTLSWATMTSMLEKVTDKNFDDLATYANRFTADFRILFYKSVRIKHPSLHNHPAFQNAMIELGRYIYG